MDETYTRKLSVQLKIEIWLSFHSLIWGTKSDYKIKDSIEMFDVLGRSLMRGKLMDPKDDTLDPVKEYSDKLTYNGETENGECAVSVGNYCHWISKNAEAPRLFLVPSRMIFVWQERLPIGHRNR